MKRVKIMLAGITILACVGGALAFRARTFGMQFCVRPTTLFGVYCNVSLIGKTTVTVAPGTYYFYTITNAAGLCIYNNKFCQPIAAKFTVE